MTDALGKCTSISLLALATLALACDTGSSSSTATDGFTMGSSDETGGDSGGTTGGSVDLAPENMVDDLEDGDDAIIEQSERGGSWFLYNDESASGMQSPDPSSSFVPTEGGPDGSGFYAQTSGNGFEEWGAGMGFDFQNDGVNKTGYDASAFTGIAFDARGNVNMRVNLMTPDILDMTLGGNCVPEGGDTGSCGDGHGVDINLTDSWQQYTIDFADVSQVGWGVSADFNPTEIVSMHFQVAQGQDFEISVDNIGLY